MVGDNPCVRRLLRILTALAGLLLLGVGAGVAGWVGSDDTVFTQPQAVGRDGRPVLTSPGLLTVDGFVGSRTRVTIRAEAPRGVLLATAHPVDVADYLGDAAHVRVEGLTTSGVETRDVAGGPLPDHAEEAGFWTRALVGEGAQELSLGSDQAGQWLIAPRGGAGPTTLSLGATLPGLHRAALLTAGVGVLLLVVAAELWLRARRRSARPPRPEGRRRASGGRTAPRTRGGGRRAARPGAASVAATAALVLLASGCSAVDAVQPHEHAVPAKVALVPEELPALLASYDARHNAALEAAGPPRHDASRWRLAERGAALEEDLFASRWAALTGARGLVRRRHTGVAVYAAEFDRYPMWAIVAARPQGWAASRVEVMLVTRASVLSPWLVHAGVPVRTGDLPAAGEAAPVPGDREVRAMARARDAWSRAVTGEEGLADDVTGRWRADTAALAAGRLFTGHRVRAAPFDAPLRVLRVEDGLLALMTLRVQTTLTGRPRLQVRWREPWDRLRGSSRGRLLLSHLATGLVLVPDEGEPRLLGSAFREVSPPRAP